MAISLYDASVARFAQTVEGVAGFLARGLNWCTAQGIDPETIVETRLIDDMLPFRFQIESIAHHSIGAIDAVRSGLFAPPPWTSTLNYADLQALIEDTRTRLAALTRDEIDALEGRDVAMRGPGFAMDFTAEGFLLSLSLPNVHFHAATAYDMLRQRGVPLRKGHYLGPFWLKG